MLTCDAAAALPSVASVPETEGALRRRRGGGPAWTKSREDEAKDDESKVGRW